MIRRLEVEYGIHISVGRVWRIMRSMKLAKISTRTRPLKRKFNVNVPNKVWVSDITYVRVANSFNYVCTIMDLYSRKIIAWRAGRNPDSLLVIQTLEEAWLKRGKPKAVMFHSDRETQYTSEAVRKAMESKNFIQSFSNSGSPHDNAVAEAFFRYLKEEELYRRNLQEYYSVIYKSS